MYVYIICRGLSHILLHVKFVALVDICSLQWNANWGVYMWLFIFSPAPDGEGGRYEIDVTIDGKSVAELGGTICNRCYFDVSLYYDCRTECNRQGIGNLVCFKF